MSEATVPADHAFSIPRYNIPADGFHVSSRPNSTWCGNLADTARGLRYLQTLHEQGRAGS